MKEECGTEGSQTDTCEGCMFEICCDTDRKNSGRCEEYDRLPF